jgi:hypothetical protein
VKPGLNQIKPPDMLQQANEAAQGGFAVLQRRGAETVRHPIEGVLNVFGTPQRALAGLKAGVQAGNPIAALGRAAYDAINPDEGQQDLDALVNSVKKYMPKTDNPVAEFAEMMGAQMLNDPLTFLPPLAAMKKTLMATKAAQGIYAGAKAVGVTLPGVKAAIKVGNRAKEAYHEHLGDEARKVFGQRPELDEHLTTGGKTARLGIEHRNIARIQDELLHDDKAILKRNAEALKNVKATSEVTTETAAQKAEKADAAFKAHEKAVYDHSLSSEAVMDPKGFDASHAFSEQMGSVPKNVQDQFQVHGTSNVRNLLEHGIDLKREFHSGPPTPGMHGVTTTRTKTPFLLISEPGKTLKETGVKYIVLNGPTKAAKAAFQKAYPNVKFMDSEEAARWMKNPKPYTPPSTHGGGGGYELPEEIRQRYLREAWRYGTPEMRAQAEHLHYKPIDADKPWEAQPENLLDYDLRKDYQFLGDLKHKLSDAPAFASHGARYGPKTARFELKRHGNWDGLEADQRDRVAARLQMGRDFVRKRRVDNETKAFLEKHGGWKSADPVDVKKLSHEPKVVWSNSPFRFFSRMGKQSVLASALPHLINNMGTLTYFQGGLPALGRTAGYMAKGLDEAQISRLKNMGAHSDYAHDFERVLGANIPGAHQTLGASNAILNRGELAMRQAILDELDRVHGPSTSDVDEFAKAQKVRDALGDYRNVSAVISLFDALGAPFAPFLGVFSKAARQTIGSDRAYRFVAPLRAQSDLDTQTEDSPQGQFQMPNPAEAYAKMLTGGGFLSPSRTGPISGILAGLDAAKKGYPQMQNLWPAIAEQLSGYGGPILSNLPAFLSMPFTAPGFDPGDFNWLGGMLHLFLGDYFKNPMSEKPDMRIQRSADRVSGG